MNKITSWRQPVRHLFSSQTKESHLRHLRPCHQLVACGGDNIVGFTLVEILTTMAIVSVLIVVSFGALGRTREAAKDVQCKNSLRQWGAAIQLYVSDNGGVLPGPCYGMVPVKPTKDQLLNYLLPYVGLETKSGSVLPDSYICKAWKSKTPDPSGSVYALQVSLAPPGGTGSWIWPFGYPGKYEPMRIVALSSLYKSSEVAVLTDVDKPYLESVGQSGLASSVPQSPVHGNHRNILFLDGHVESSKGTTDPWP